MRPANCGLTPEGYPVIFLTTLATLVFALCECLVPALICFGLCWLSVHFFRDPERVVPYEQNIAVSPADGRIVAIEKRSTPISGEECTCISIFMNIFNVHVNRMPVAGTIRDIKYWPGKYFNASLDKASIYNERCAYLINSEEEEQFCVVQIAGLIARRIVCRVEVGDSLKRAERFGMIRFGSRLDLYIPSSYIPSVSIGETVLAGQSIVARKGN